MYHFDVLVVGAGAVGLACANELQKKFNSVLVIEKNEFIASETSSRNSEVIHSGIYYEPNSLKANLCVEGRNLLYSFCDKYGIKYKKCGKLIISASDKQSQKLASIYKRGMDNKVENISILDRKGINKIEPNLDCNEAIFVKEAGVFDSHCFIEQLEKNFIKNDGLIVKKSEFISAERKNNKFYIKIISGEETEISADFLINAGGLHATAVAKKISNIKQKYIFQTIYSKGTYFSTNKKSPFNSLIYPVPDEHGLGIHLTKDISGKVKFGPDHEFVEEIDYSLNENKKLNFISKINNFWPEIREEDIYADYVGIRPKISGMNQNNQDFIIQGQLEHKVEGLFNLYGIESPGLTSSLAIGKYIKEII